MLNLASILAGLVLSTGVESQCTQAWNELEFRDVPPLGKVLVADIGGGCTFAPEGHGGIDALNLHFRDRVTKDSLEVHAGPVEEVWQDLPSVKYDVTTRISGEAPQLLEVDLADSADIRSDVHIAQEGAKLLRFDSVSTKIVQASGNYKQLKKSDSFSAVTLLSPNDATATVRGVLYIKKPPLIPNDFFKDQIKKAIEGEFPRIQSELVAEVAAVL